MKRLMAIILALLLLTGCSKGNETIPEAGEEKELKPFQIVLFTDSREVSLEETLQGTYDKPFEVNFWFNGMLSVEEKDIDKYLMISPEGIKPELRIIKSEDIDTTRICADFTTTGNLPDEINIVLKAGITDDEGSTLKEDINISLTKQKEINAVIRLESDPTINSETGFNFNSYMLDDKDKAFEVTFNYPMDKESVENAFMNGFQYVPEEYMARVDLEWKDESSLTVSFSDMHVGQSYPISFNGAKTADGKEYKEFEMNKVFGFLVQNANKISKVDDKGNIVKDLPIENEIIELEDVSPSGSYAFGYRILDTAGDFYPVKPILLELQDDGIKKHFLNDMDYIQGVIFGSKWTPDGKGFLVYTSKKIWYYSLDGALKGQPGKVIFEYDASKMDYILGAELSPGGDKIAVFKSKYTESFEDEESRLVDICYIDLNGKAIDTMEDVLYHNSSDGFPIPPKYSWTDNDTIISEGFSQKRDKADIYKISLKEKKVEVMVSDASNPSVIGDVLIVRKTEYDDNNGYLVFGDGNIINMKNNNIEDVIMGNLTYSVYGLGEKVLAYELYEDDFTTYIYDRTQKKLIKQHKGMIFGADKDYFYIIK